MIDKSYIWKTNTPEEQVEQEGYRWKITRDSETVFESYLPNRIGDKVFLSGEFYTVGSIEYIGNYTWRVDLTLKGENNAE